MNENDINGVKVNIGDIVRRVRGSDDSFMQRDNTYIVERLDYNDNVVWLKGSGERNWSIDYFEVVKKKEVNKEEIEKMKKMTPQEFIMHRMLVMRTDNIVRMRKQYKIDVESLQKDINAYNKSLKEHEESLKMKNDFLNAKNKKITLKDIDLMLSNIKKNPEISKIELVSKKTSLSNDKSSYLYGMTSEDYQINIITKPLKMKDIRDKTREVEIGNYKININLNEGMDNIFSRVLIYNEIVEKFINKFSDNPLNDNIREFYVQHPHVQSQGNQCLGNATMFFNNLGRMEIDDFIEGMLEYLKSYNEESPFRLFYGFANFVKFCKEFVKFEKIGRYRLSNTKYLQSILAEFSKNSVNMNAKILSIEDMKSMILTRLENEFPTKQQKFATSVYRRLPRGIALTYNTQGDDTNDDEDVINEE